VSHRRRRSGSSFAHVPLRTPAAITAVLALAMSASGCLSHEYRVSHEELMRIAALPPDVRGDHVRVVQELGTRRSAPVSREAPAPQPEATGGGEVVVDFNVNVGGTGHGGHAHGQPPGAHSGSGRVVSAHPVGAGGGKVEPPSGQAGGGGSLGNISSGGGGGGNGEGLVVLAVVVVAIAVLAVLGLAVTEGLRYDGEIAVAPGQILYLDKATERLQVAVAELTPADAALASGGAILRDDEGWGFYHWGRAPLDRRGAAFKVDFGGFETLLDNYDVAGFASHIQVGGFPCQWLGLLGSWAVTAAQDSQGNLFARHNFALEAQVFPVHLGPLSLGLFGHAGPSLATGQGGGTESSLAAGGGAMLELALTTRLALTFRADWTGTRATPERWTPSTTLSGGLAIY
jgi:hypothetical protein